MILMYRNHYSLEIRIITALLGSLERQGRRGAVVETLFLASTFLFDEAFKNLGSIKPRGVLNLKSDTRLQVGRKQALYS